MPQTDYNNQFLRRQKGEENDNSFTQQNLFPNERGEVPLSINLAPKLVVWVKREVEEWIETQIKTSRFTA